MWPKVSETTRNAIKKGLFDGLMSHNMITLKHFERVLAAVGTIEIAQHMWESFVTDIAKLIKEGNINVKITLIIVLSYVCEDSVCFIWILLNLLNNLFIIYL